MKPDTKFKFGEWLPDQPELDNPGVIEALNVLPIGSSYAPYAPLVTSQNAMANSAVDAVALLTGSGFTPAALYVGTALGNIYQSLAPFGSTWTDQSGGVLGRIYDLAQYNESIIATDGVAHPVYKTIGLTGTFSTLGGGMPAPICQVLGVIGQFLVVGCLTALQLPHAIQWSGIENIISWPTPNSAQALAEQSGQQVLHGEFGNVTAIHGTDQTGIIIQQSAITRAIYAGGQTVFQFDTISRGIGMDSRRLSAMVENIVYFLSSKGFFATDGTSVFHIGDEKVNRYLFSVLDQANIFKARCAVDWNNKLIYWCIPRTTDSGLPNAVFIYNYLTKRWTHAEDVIATLIGGDQTDIQSSVWAIGQDRKFGTLTGTPTAAKIVTAETEFFPGKRSIVTAVTPELLSTTAVTVRLGHRSKQSDAVTYSAAMSPDSFTGDCNFFVDDRFHRAEVNITGNFSQATGGTFDAQPSSAF